MLWKLEDAALDRPREPSAPSETAREPTPDAPFPTPGEVLCEMAITLVTFLVIALVLHRLFDVAAT